MPFGKSFDPLHIYFPFDYCVRETIFERQLRSRANCCCFAKRHYVVVSAVPPLACSGLLVPVPDFWRFYEWPRLISGQMPIAMAYYSNLVISWRPPELNFRIAISEICVRALFVFLI